MYIRRRTRIRIYQRILDENLPTKVESNLKTFLNNFLHALFNLIEFQRNQRQQRVTRKSAHQLVDTAFVIIKVSLSLVLF